MKKNLTLVLALAIPVAMIVFIAASIYLPRLFIHPQVSFLYSATGYRYDSNGSVYYKVVDHKLQKVQNPQISLAAPQPTKAPAQQVQYPAIYRYDAMTNTSSEVSLDQAAALTIDENPISAEGYQITPGNRSGGFLDIFGGYDANYNKLYLKNGSFSREINLSGIRNTDYFYFGNFGFIGWIIK